MTSTFDNVPTLFGWVLATHRALVYDSNNISYATGNTSIVGDSNLVLEEYFPYEPIIAAIAISFFRSTVRLQQSEPMILRWFFCILLASLAYTKKSYELITAVEIFSYTVSWLIVRPIITTSSSSSSSRSSSAIPQSTRHVFVLQLLSIATGAVVSMLISHAIFTVAMSNPMMEQIYRFTPSIVTKSVTYLFPIYEMKAAYRIMEQFAMDHSFFQKMIHHLFFVTFHIQVGMGFIGIAFLRAEQSRRNELIRLDVQEKVESSDENSSSVNTSNGAQREGGNKQMLEKSRLFQRGAAPFSKCSIFCD
jgi:hypothetical protein